jgi:hypothetical protein
MRIAIAAAKTRRAARSARPSGAPERRFLALCGHAQSNRSRLVYKLKQYKGLNKICRLAAALPEPVK